MKKLPYWICALIIGSFGLGTHASAEQVVKIFAGPAFTQDKDIRERYPFGTFILRNADFENSVSFGASLTHWFATAPFLGLGLDVSHFRLDMDRQDGTECFASLGVTTCDPFTFPSRRFRTTALLFNVLARMPVLVSQQFPHGRFQPYLSAGPTLFFTRMRDSGGLFTPGNQTDRDAALGASAGAGLSWLLTPNIDLFAEYRFSHFKPEFRVRDDPDRVRVTTTFNSHRALFGISYHFCALGC